MISSYAAAAIRSFRRNPFFLVLDVAGLAIGIAAALVIALYVADELSYERFLVDRDRVFRISSDSIRSGVSLSTSQWQVAEYLTLDYPEITSVTRLLADNRGIRRGDVEFNEDLYWVDPTFFSVIPLPMHVGDAGSAFKDPASVVITARVARKYFGREDVRGEVLQIDRQYDVVVSAVLRDLPSTTHLNTEILVSGNAAFSKLRTIHLDYSGLIAPVHTYFRLAPGADVGRLRRDMPSFIDRHWSGAPGVPTSTRIGFTILPVSEIHLGSKALFSMKPAGDRTTVLSLGLVALLIVIAACINFVNLMIACTSRRTLEVGVRKCLGAGRGHLFVHFVGEAVALVALAVLCAVLLTVAVLPLVESVLQREIASGWSTNPWLIAAMGAGAALMAIAASVYPALVLSAFRPADVMRAGRGELAGTGRLRRALAIVQFAILIGLLVATGTIHAQMRYAIDRATAGGEDPVLIVRTDCSGAFPDAVRQLPGVRGAACSQSAPTNYDRRGTSATRPGSDTSLQIDLSIVDFGFFELYGLKPLAGRLFSRDFPADAVPEERSQPFRAPLVLNESAVKKFGFRSPAEAVGKELRLGHVRNAQPSLVVGVVPDFPVESLREAVGATAFYVDPGGFELLSIGLRRERLAESVARIHALWKRASGTGRPLNSFFIDTYVRDLYAQMRVQGALFGALSVVATTIACIGLFSLAALTSQWRTREIGIRKALGAEKRNVLWLLMWQFAKPVLWANVIAWPVAELFLSRWLAGFTDHIDLPWWLFVACGVLTLALALVVVSTHAVRAASSRPIEALREE